MDLYKRVSFPIANAGLALRSIDSVYLSAFICSMAASSKYLAKIFPDWIQTSIVDNVHKITSINENISPYTDNQIMYCAEKIQSIVPNGHFEGLTLPALIINKLVELSNQKTAYMTTFLEKECLMRSERTQEQISNHKFWNVWENGTA